MEISIEEAYKEACQALGESIVRERLLSSRLVQNATAPQPQPKNTSGIPGAVDC